MAWNDPLAALLLCAKIEGIAVLVQTLEQLALWRQYRRAGLYDWEVNRTRTLELARSKLLPFYDGLFRFPGLWVVFGLRLLGAVLQISGNARSVVVAGLYLTATTAIVQTIRDRDGYGGSDQVTTIISVALALVLTSSNPALWTAGAVFLAGQACLAYATSGFTKLAHADWRSERHLLLVLRNRGFGHRGLYVFLSARPVLAKYLSLAFIAFECSFPAFMLAGPHAFLVAICAALLFHFSIAVVMGINFFWSYAAFLPAAYYVSCQISEFLKK